MGSIRVLASATAIRQIGTLLVLLSILPLGSITPSAQTTAGAPADKEQAIARIITATVIAHRLHSQSLVGYVAIFVSESNWGALVSDSDLGPLLRFKEPKAGRSAVVLMASLKDLVFCTYFDGSSPFGTVAIGPGGTKITAAQVEKAYQPIRTGMTEPTGNRLHFDEGTITTDDGRQVPSYKITAEEQQPAK